MMADLSFIEDALFIMPQAWENEKNLRIFLN